MKIGRLDTLYLEAAFWSPGEFGIDNANSLDRLRRTARNTTEKDIAKEVIEEVLT